MAHPTHSKTLPADLGAPLFVNAWRTRALIVCVVFSIVAVVLALLGQAQDRLGWEHVLRAWDLGLMMTFGFCVGGLGAAHGAVLLRRQVGAAAAAAAGGDEPHAAAGLSFSGFP